MEPLNKSSLYCVRVLLLVLCVSFGGVLQFTTNRLRMVMLFYMQHY